MKLKITKAKAEFSIVDHKKEVVFVEFPNCISTTTNKSFKWMPTYKEIADIINALSEIEELSWKKEK